MAVAKKAALLVGCNYPDLLKDIELHGCINDVKAMHALILQPRFGFKNENITILTDETEKKPTRHNILGALKKIIDDAKKGDTLLFYFSGGGALVLIPLIPKPISFPVIVPYDLNPISGYDIRSELKRLPDGTFFTFICDSSYSGGLFGEKVQTESNVPDYVNNCNFKSKTIPFNLLQPINVSENLPAGIPPPPKHIILFSSSRGNEESVEVHLNCDVSMAFSAYSGAIQQFFNSPLAVNGLKAPYANREVAAFTRASLGFLVFDQRPYLNCSDIDAAAPFLGEVGLLGDLHVV